MSHGTCLAAATGEEQILCLGTWRGEWGAPRGLWRRQRLHGSGSVTGACGGGGVARRVWRGSVDTLQSGDQCRASGGGRVRCSGSTERASLVEIRAAWRRAGRGDTGRRQDRASSAVWPSFNKYLLVFAYLEPPTKIPAFCFYFFNLFIFLSF